MSETNSEGLSAEAIRSHNEAMWDLQVDQENRWTIPVSPAEIARARRGDFAIVVTPSRPVPRDWFPEELQGCEALCLAGGGGQQAPILAAAGARVTVLDNAPRQLAQDRKVAAREGLELETAHGDMSDLSMFGDAAFDLVVHPCANVFVPDILPVWRETHRVLRQGGVLIAGFCNPAFFIFDERERERGVLRVRHRIPYSDLEELSERELADLEERGEPWCFGHTLEDQLGGQMSAGFVLTAMFEDDWGPDSDDVLSKHIKPFTATRAVK